jgi:hypothetical protein
MISRPEISWFDNPSATSRSTSVSRGVSLSRTAAIFQTPSIFSYFSW